MLGDALGLGRRRHVVRPEENREHFVILLRNEAGQILKGNRDLRLKLIRPPDLRQQPESAVAHVHIRPGLRRGGHLEIAVNLPLPGEGQTHHMGRGDQQLVFQIEANAFLWKMVRSITGTLIQLAQKKCSPDEFKKILESRDRTKAGITAPPTGLFLWEVKFDGIRRHV